MDVEIVEQKVSEAEPDLDRVAQQDQNFFKFRNFYEQMDFTTGQRLAITKAIIKLIGLLGGSDLIQEMPRKERDSMTTVWFSTRTIGRFCLVIITGLLTS